MSNLYFSKSTLGFYKGNIYAESLPVDVIEITEETWQSMLQGQSRGKIISVDDSGNPILKDPPPPTEIAIIYQATMKRENSFSEAAVAISPLQDAVDLGIATENEMKMLKRWKEYRVALNRLDMNQATDIKWPAVPSI